MSKYRRVLSFLFLFACFFLISLVLAQVANSKAAVNDNLETTTLSNFKDQSLAFNESTQTYTGRIEYSDATCYFISTEASISSLDSLNRIKPLGCIAK